MVTDGSREVSGVPLPDQVRSRVFKGEIRVRPPPKDLLLYLPLAVPSLPLSWGR